MDKRNKTKTEGCQKTQEDDGMAVDFSSWWRLRSKSKFGGIVAIREIATATVELRRRRFAF